MPFSGSSIFDEMARCLFPINRYRLMLRRCLESPNPSFGMILPPREASRHGPSSSLPTNHDFGTMLEIRSVQMLPDGRSMVETVGSHRFRILERGALDGYMVGRIERCAFLQFGYFLSSVLPLWDISTYLHRDLLKISTFFD